MDKPDKSAGPTSALDVCLPVEVVELKILKNRDGTPVRVLCEGVDEAVVLGILKSLPGDRVQAARQRVEAKRAAEEAKRRGEAPAADPPLTSEAIHERAAIFDEYGPQLIERGTALLDGNGGEVRPAFWFDPAKPRHPLSIAGRLLRFEDRVLLATTISRLSGYTADEEEGAGDGAGFPPGDGDRGNDGVGAVAPGEVQRPDAVGSPP